MRRETSRKILFWGLIAMAQMPSTAELLATPTATYEKVPEPKQKYPKLKQLRKLK